MSNFKNIIEGNHLLCQKLKTKKKPCLILNTEFFKRSDRLFFLKALLILSYSNIFSKNWNGMNILNYSLYENGSYITQKFQNLKLKNFLNFSALYLLNIGINNMLLLKRITEKKLLGFNYRAFNNKKPLNHLILNQSSLFIDKLPINDQIQVDIKNYFFLPNSMFYENEETFVNTKGIFCHTRKIVSRKKTKNNWQILRKIFSVIHDKLRLLTDRKQKNNQIISPNFNSINNFKNYINFIFYATIGLAHLNFYLHKETKTFVFLKNIFKQKVAKVYNTKLTYWLDDFFAGGKDEYSYNSKILSFCSHNTKIETTVFF
jgi:hypothetical protein